VDGGGCGGGDTDGWRVEWDVVEAGACCAVDEVEVEVEVEAEDEEGEGEEADERLCRCCCVC